MTTLHQRNGGQTVDTQPAGKLSEAEFDRLQAKPWRLIGKPSRTKLDGYRFATWFGAAILAGLALAHIAGRFGWL